MDINYLLECFHLEDPTLHEVLSPRNYILEDFHELRNADDGDESVANGSTGSTVFMKNCIHFLLVS